MYITIGSFKGRELVFQLKKAPVGSTVYRFGVDWPTVYQKQPDETWATNEYNYTASQWESTTGLYVVKYKMAVEEELD